MKTITLNCLSWNERTLAPAGATSLESIGFFAPASPPLESTSIFLDLLVKGKIDSPVRFERESLSLEINKSIYGDLDEHIGQFTQSDDLETLNQKFIDWIQDKFNSENNS